MSRHEEIDVFACFGSKCSVLVSGESESRTAREAVERARGQLLEWHGRFSRFISGSELSLLNADERETVPVSPMMGALVVALARAGSITAGLVDGTLLAPLVQVGYVSDLPPAPSLGELLARAPQRRAAGRSVREGWRELRYDALAGTVTRPPGFAIDSGGLAKGLFADVLARELALHPGFAVSCAGDLAIGGAQSPRRELTVESPFDGSAIHSFGVTRTGVATSGISRRSWFDAQGNPVHHLLDPATGRPAFTGIVQATALAPSALDAEMYAKAALLSGPARARGWLPHGGVLVFDDASHEVIAQPQTVTIARSEDSGASSRARSEHRSAA
jgi:thiamine biosynthesis lipoprotein